MEAILGILIPLTFVVMLVVERLAPARPLPVVRGWLLKGIVFFVLAAVVNAAIPALVAQVLGNRAPLHLSLLPMFIAVPIAMLVADLFAYGVHRFMHTVPFVWRWTHQMHHSAERMDMAGATYFHPIDMVVTVSVSTVVSAFLGLEADAAALTGYLGFVWGVFQHMNVRTPQWLGYLIQRPEAHSVHHARGVHAYNYGNIPVWDLLFGTFRNPPEFVAEAGFWDGASREMGAMLLGRDVSAPRAGASREVTTASA